MKKNEFKQMIQPSFVVQRVAIQYTKIRTTSNKRDPPSSRLIQHNLILELVAGIDFWEFVLVKKEQAGFRETSPLFSLLLFEIYIA